MTAQKQQMVNFQIKGIELLDTTIKHPEKPVPKQPVYKFNINLQQTITPENNLIFVICTVDVLLENMRDKIGSIKTSCIFEVKDLNSYADKEKNQIILPDELIASLNAISISTTRGIMFATFKGTFLHNAYLPVIDPRSFMRKK